MFGNNRTAVFVSVLGVFLLMTALCSAQITGSGTAGTIPVFTGTSTIGSSTGNVSIGTNPSVPTNIGIGTASPTFNLHVVTSQPANQTAAVALEAYGAVGINYIGRRAEGTINVPTGALQGDQLVSLIGEGYGKTGFSPYSRANIKLFATENWSDTAQGAYIAFATTNAGTAPNSAATERMRIDNAGNVGIGTSAPSSLLTVAGAIQTTTGGVIYPDGTQQTTAWTGVLCGGDYAESVAVSGERTRYEPGDVVVIDPENPGSFAKSFTPYSTGIAGIYSTKPGAIGRRSNDPDKAKSDIPMAMVGIVPAKVSAENGPIRPGDLLVTSATLGYAMKGTDRSQLPGAIVGKALGPLNSGTGVIDVLVTLQ